ncbi:hypothetical protein F5Y16DRAFT_375537 [Xylariaceae sp. FL0255]|nr:hypothetical protein F5Y16DRAFT_375537 [Xylariaceae sp. FL0255]
MGLLWRVDISTGKTDVAIQVPEMSNGSPGNLAVQGINGVRIAGDGYLYWSNSVLTTIYRVKIDAATGSIAHGATVETVSKIPDVSFVDDIAVGEDVIFAATNTNNTLVATKPFANETVVVLGNQDTLTVAGDTAAIWGRGENDKKTLYVSTSGAIKAPVNGTLYEPGKVVAVDTTGFRL